MGVTDQQQLMDELESYETAINTTASMCIIFVLTMILLILIPLAFSYYARSFFQKRIAGGSGGPAWVTDASGASVYTQDGLTIHRPPDGRPKLYMGTMELTREMIFYIAPPQEMASFGIVPTVQRAVLPTLTKSQIQVVRNFVYMYGYGEEVVDLRGWPDAAFQDDVGFPVFSRQQRFA
jgi:hypothetical protein